MHFVKPRGLSYLPTITQPVARIMGVFWQGFLRQSYSVRLSRILESLVPDDFVFRETAFAMMSIARGASGGLTIGYDSIVRGHDAGDFDAHRSWATASVGSGRDGPCRHFASKLATGYHEAGLPPGSAPAETTYWLSGIIVRLAVDLEDDARVLENIKAAVAFGLKAQSDRRSFNILLFSIKDIVIARVYQGKIQRTKSMTLFDIAGPYTWAPWRGPECRTFKTIEKPAKGVPKKSTFSC